MGADEELEIAFWWFGGDSQHRIEDGLEDYLDQRTRSRRRPRTFPGNRPRAGRPGRPGTLGELGEAGDIGEQGRPVA